MIFGTLDIDFTQFHLPTALEEALTFLKEHDFMAMEPRRVGIDGERMYANVDAVSTRRLTDTKPEQHKRYIDVQFMVQGHERIGFTCDRGQATPTEAMPERDLWFYDTTLVDEGVLDLREGCYAIFFPEDIHRPLMAIDDTPQAVRKVVVKVSVEAL